MHIAADCLLDIFTDMTVIEHASDRTVERREDCKRNRKTGSAIE